MIRALHSGLAALMLLVAAAAPGLVIGGGGPAATDCLLALSVDANFPLADPRQVRCVDGDPACDDDALVNGVCDLRVQVCANSTFDPACALSGLRSVTVEHALDNGDPRFDPDFQSLQTRIDSDFGYPVSGADACSTVGIVHVPIKGPLGRRNACGRQKKKLTLRALSISGPGGTHEDKDTLKLYCEPAPVDGCDPQALFASTFDRIQRQIFNRSCALGGCHDSQSQSGGLLLETGAAYTNLVDRPPANPAAVTAGWLRVDATPAGDPTNAATSYLLHKLGGDLPDASYGARMPLGRPKLPKSLRDVIAQWIEAGAPAGGWVPGTF